MPRARSSQSPRPKWAGPRRPQQALPRPSSASARGCARRHSALRATPALRRGSAASAHPAPGSSPAPPTATPGHPPRRAWRPARCLRRGSGAAPRALCAGRHAPAAQRADRPLHGDSPARSQAPALRCRKALEIRRCARPRDPHGRGSMSAPLHRAGPTARPWLRRPSSGSAGCCQQVGEYDGVDGGHGSSPLGPIHAATAAWAYQAQTRRACRTGVARRAIGDRCLRPTAHPSSTPRATPPSTCPTGVRRGRSWPKAGKAR